MTQLTTQEIAGRFNVDRRTVVRWAHEGRPRPVGQTDFNGHSNLYDWNAVKAWAIETGRWDDVVDMPTARVGRPYIEGNSNAISA